MTTFEVLTIVGGLVLGWTAVSYLISTRRRSRRSEDLVAYSDMDLETAWPTLLGVSESASREDIRQAYDLRLAELIDRSPRVMTEGERAAQRSAKNRLMTAYRFAERQAETG